MLPGARVADCAVLQTDDAPQTATISSPPQSSGRATRCVPALAWRPAVPWPPVSGPLHTRVHHTSKTAPDAETRACASGAWPGGGGDAVPARPLPARDPPALGACRLPPAPRPQGVAGTTPHRRPLCPRVCCPTPGCARLAPMSGAALAHVRP
eukprot:1252844-Rhodomonas_salina.2